MAALKIKLKKHYLEVTIYGYITEPYAEFYIFF